VPRPAGAPETSSGERRTARGARQDGRERTRLVARGDEPCRRGHQHSGLNRRARQAARSGEAGADIRPQGPVNPSNGRILAEWIRHGREPARVAAPAHGLRTVRRSLARWRFTRPFQIDRNRVRPLRDDQPATVKKDQQISGAIVINIYDRPEVFVCGRLELFDEIDLPVEVPIRFAPDQRTLVVVLVDVGAAVKVTVDGHLGENSPLVVLTPHIRSTVAIAIFHADAPSGRP